MPQLQRKDEAVTPVLHSSTRGSSPNMEQSSVHSWICCSQEDCPKASSWASISAVIWEP